MSREQIVRDTAYAIWEAEGKPEGRDREHWTQAEARVAASVKDGEAKLAKADAAKAKNGAEPKATAPAKGKATTAKDAAPKPPAKPAATKAAPSKAAAKK